MVEPTHLKNMFVKFEVLAKKEGENKTFLQTPPSDDDDDDDGDEVLSVSAGWTQNKELRVQEQTVWMIFWIKELKSLWSFIINYWRRVNNLLITIDVWP